MGVIPQGDPGEITGSSSAGSYEEPGGVYWAGAVLDTPLALSRPPPVSEARGCLLRAARKLMAALKEHLVQAEIRLEAQGVEQAWTLLESEPIDSCWPCRDEEVWEKVFSERFRQVFQKANKAVVLIMKDEGIERRAVGTEKEPFRPAEDCIVTQWP